VAYGGMRQALPIATYTDCNAMPSTLFAFGRSCRISSATVASNQPPPSSCLGQAWLVKLLPVLNICLVSVLLLCSPPPFLPLGALRACLWRMHAHTTLPVSRTLPHTYLNYRRCYNAWRAAFYRTTFLAPAPWTVMHLPECAAGG